MDPYLHTTIALFIIIVTFYIGKRAARVEERYNGAENIISILEAEGTYSRKNITDAVERWIDSRGEDEV
tara:strand:+ start:2841 stop:3047 length:207 start_codon:yes stop_codon:yes gene_type:complete